MSSEQGGRKSKKNRRRNRGRGQQQQQQQQSLPGGLQERDVKETQGATALSLDEPTHQTTTREEKKTPQQQETSPQQPKPAFSTVAGDSSAKHDSSHKKPDSFKSETLLSTDSKVQQPQSSEIKPQSPSVISEAGSSKGVSETSPTKTSKRNRGRRKKATPTSIEKEEEFPELTVQPKQQPSSFTKSEAVVPLKIPDESKSSGKTQGTNIKITSGADDEPFPVLTPTSSTVPTPSSTITQTPSTTDQPQHGTPSKPQQPSAKKRGKKKGTPSHLESDQFPTLTAPTQPMTNIQPIKTPSPTIPQQPQVSAIQQQMTTPSKSIKQPSPTIPLQQQKATPSRSVQPSSIPQQQAPLTVPHQPLGTSERKTSQTPGASATGTRPKQPTQQLVTQFQSSPQSTEPEFKPIRRPDRGGTSGRPIKLQVNFYPVEIPKDDIHHYDTDIKPKVVPKSGDGYTKSEAPRIIQMMVKQYEKENPSGPKLVYDRNGKNLYCRKPIPGIGKDRREFNVTFTTDDGKNREYTVKVKWVSQVSLYYLEQAIQGKDTEIPQETIQAVEVVLRHLPYMTMIPIRSQFYPHPNGQEIDLDYGVQMWNGKFLSFRPTQWKMVLNVDTCSTAFYKEQSVLDFMCEFLYLRHIPARLNDDDCMKFGNEIKGVKIETTHTKRKQKVNGYCKSARTREFKCEDKTTTVFEYFKQAYNKTLNYPDLPCVKVGQKSFIPIELCNIVKGQRKESKLTPQQTRDMIKHTALPAPERQRKINTLVQNPNFLNDPYHREFGIRVGQNMTKVTGRVLQPPTIAYGPAKQPAIEMPKDGKWNMQHTSYQPVELREWAILSFENPQFLNNGAIDFFIKNLVDGGQAKGVRIHPSPCYRTSARGYQQINQIFGQLKKDYLKLQLIIVIFPGKVSGFNETLDDYYEHVKHFGDVIYGLNTQCLLANTVKRKAGDKQTIANLCLKINAKLGGTSFIIDQAIRSPILKRPVIIFGADVTHPSPARKKEPSIAAVVANVDKHPNLYSAEVRVQKHGQEKIEEMKDMVQNLLKKFRDKTNAKPEKIIFYRDGVSEGQFKETLIHELQAIQKACFELHPNYKPGITFIVVQKRHHTKFFAEDPRDQCGKSRNIPAGTIVDQNVCHPREFDWYLCSHAGIQGTSKPAHYRVLYDDNNFHSDEIQILTNQLCHTYVRCARAVSIPAPAYYAHHVAFRARYHLNEVEKVKGAGSVSSGDSDEVDGLPTDYMIQAVTVHENMNTAMYFA